MLIQHGPHQVTGTSETCCKVAELPQKAQPAEAGASAKSALTDGYRCSSSRIPSRILSAGSSGTNNSTCSS